MSTSRRTFLTSAAIPITAASASRVLGANDRVRLGLIGCGGMGRGDLNGVAMISWTVGIA